MAQQLQRMNGPITINYGTDGENVIMMFSQRIDHNVMTIAQANAMIRAIQETIASIAKAGP